MLTYLLVQMTFSEKFLFWSYFQDVEFVIAKYSIHTVVVTDSKH